jgi:D-ribose pyranase
MLRTGILNPALLSLLARVRHTNTLVIADRGFLSWPEMETIDLSLVDEIPTVSQVVAAIRPNFAIARAFLAEEFRNHNSKAAVEELLAQLRGVPVEFKPHLALKRRVPVAIGIIRTGDTRPYSNLILESGGE